MLGGPTIAQKYKLRHNVPFYKEKFQYFLFRGARDSVFPGPVFAIDGPDFKRLLHG